MYGDKVDRDAWFTPIEIADYCVSKVYEDYPELKKVNWTEPSAGTGVFIESAKKQGIKNVRGIDIDPQGKGIEEKDFLTMSKFGDNLNGFVFGNPPYGKRQGLSIAFIEQSFNLGAEKVGFLLPSSILYYWYLKKLNRSIEKVYQIPEKIEFLNIEGEVAGRGNNASAFIIFRKERLEEIEEEVITWGTLEDYDVACGSKEYVYKEDGVEFIPNPNVPTRMFKKGAEVVKSFELFKILDKEEWSEDLYTLLGSFSLSGRITPETYNYWVSRQGVLSGK